MDNPKTTSGTVDCVEWFFGYGGNHLGIKTVVPNLRLIAACEIEAYSACNMVQKMEAGLLDAAPCWTNCRTFPSQIFRGLVDIFIASYPCQGFSYAGKRLGESDPRYLWPDVRRGVEFMRPAYCFFENVEGHVTLGLSRVISDLHSLGYVVANERGEPTWGIFSAEECGAPQSRKRVFILAKDAHGKEGRDAITNIGGTSEELEHAAGIRAGSVRVGDATSEPRPADAGLHVADPARLRREQRSGHTGRETQASGPTGCQSELGLHGCGNEVGLADSISQGLQRGERAGTHGERSSASEPASECSPLFWPGFVARPGEQQHGWEPPRVIETKRGLGRSTDGCSDRMDGCELERMKNENLQNLQQGNQSEGQKPSEILQPGMLREVSDGSKSEQNDNSETGAASSSKNGRMREMRIDGQAPETSSGLFTSDIRGDSLQRLSLENSRRRKWPKKSDAGTNVDRLRMLGNGVYPATAAKAFLTLFKRLHK